MAQKPTDIDGEAAVLTIAALLLLQERVWEDVAVATSFRQADRSWARR